MLLFNSVKQILAFANIKPPFKKEEDGMTTLPSRRVKSSLPYISV
jgi:hypothetical protein